MPEIDFAPSVSLREGTKGYSSTRRLLDIQALTSGYFPEFPPKRRPKALNDDAERGVDRARPTPSDSLLAQPRSRTRRLSPGARRGAIFHDANGDAFIDGPAGLPNDTCGNGRKEPAAAATRRMRVGGGRRPGDQGAIHARRRDRLPFVQGVDRSPFVHATRRRGYDLPRPAGHRAR